jgi:predicted metalloprotease
MRWRSGRRSSNVEDRRGITPKKAVGGGLGIVVIAVIAMLFGVDPSTVINMLNQAPIQTEQGASRTVQQGATDELADFVSVVLGDTEDTWHELFRQMDRTYEEPKLVLFSNAVQSACGYAQSAMGPFYCPGDKKVYIDLTFYQDLRDRFKAPGDFAQAYVIAHEVGHHVQNILGVSPKVQAMRQQVSETEANQLSVRLELQADCLAGVWAYHANKARNIIEKGDVQEALGAATAIGDDRLQQQSRGYVTPDSFTHGSSEQRVRWFTKGIKTGSIGECNTFSAETL